MKQWVFRVNFSKVFCLSLLFLTQVFALSVNAQEAEPVCGPGDAAKGKQLFNQNCAACHALDRNMTGPALANVATRLTEDEGLDCEWIFSWIRNSAGLIASGDSYANKIYGEYSQAAMTAFPTLSDQDINDILAYTAAKPATPAPDEAGGGPVVVQEQAGGISNEVILGALALLFALLVMMLFMVNKTLRSIAQANGIELEKLKEGKSGSLWQAFAKNQFLVLCTAIVFLLVSAYFAYGYMSQIGVDQGYQPVQPIHFSHKIHAGDNKIDCQYCHSAARVSKTSGIPSVNVCMNCHKSIYQYTGEADLANGHTQEFYTGEIKKLYAAAGWDEDKQQYTGEGKPIEWVKVHNLPDFAFFSHAQHVTAGAIECQTCHGPVEEMEVVEQYSPLTMGWCVNCHRDTEVQLTSNGYYAKMHEELAKKYGVDKLTVAQMGGLECGKCHY